jgi:DNA-binding MarR family transcriptional regulator
MASTNEVREALTAASRAFKAAGAESLRTIGLHPGQDFLLVALLEEDTLTTGELARRLRVESPTVTRMAQRMEVAGLVLRASDPDDARRTRNSLTRRGREVAAALPKLLDDVLDRAVEGLTPGELDRLRDALTLIAENLGWGETSESADTSAET